MQSRFQTLNIQAGELKGRKIPVPNSLHKLHFTSAKFKEAVFSILEAMCLKGMIQKEKSIFIDLFAGSGQMGFESYSRGYPNVILVELEKPRFQSIVEFSNKLHLPLTLHNKDSFRLIKNFQKNENTLIFFIDPPYSFWETQTTKLLDMISYCKSLNSILLVQTPRTIKLESLEPRRFGKNLLWVGVFLDSKS